VKKIIYLYLCGGLGNQLFQYAAARNLAIKNNAQIILDVSAGFPFIKKNFLQFSLNKKKLINVKFKKNIFIFWLYRIFKKIFTLKKVFYNFNCNIFVNEMSSNNFNKRIMGVKIIKNLFLFGYFQSEKYFFHNKDIIIKELLPEAPINKLFLDIKNKITNKNSISLGLRIYEEYNNDNYKIGGIVKLDFYKIAIENFLKDVKNPEFFIFSTTKANVNKLISSFKELKKYRINIITEDMGYTGAMDNLWLMSHSRNQIISNSTLYWWSAYFAKYRYKSNAKIICSGNFFNNDTCLDEWKLSR
jgi:hypothetical protein